MMELAEGQRKAGHNQTELSSSAGIIFTTSSTSNGQEMTSSPPSKKGVATSGNFHHSDSLPAMTLTKMQQMSKSEEVVAVETSGKSASGYQVGVAVCQQEGVAGDEDKGMELVLPSSKELLKVRQRKKVISSVIIIIIVCQGCFFSVQGVHRTVD